MGWIWGGQSSHLPLNKSYVFSKACRSAPLREISANDQPAETTTDLACRCLQDAASRPSTPNTIGVRISQSKRGSVMTEPLEPERREPVSAGRCSDTDLPGRKRRKCAP